MHKRPSSIIGSCLCIVDTRKKCVIARGRVTRANSGHTPNRDLSMYRRALDGITSSLGVIVLLITTFSVVTIERASGFNDMPWGWLRNLFMGVKYIRRRHPSSDTNRSMKRTSILDVVAGFITLYAGPAHLVYSLG